MMTERMSMIATKGNLKRLLILHSFLLVCLSAIASSVDVGRARVAASNWISRIKGPDFPFNNNIVASFTLPVCNGDGHVHVMNLEGGGFVVTSSDSSMSPIIAFSKTGSLDGTGDGGLKFLVEASMGGFLRARAAVESSDKSRQTKGRKSMSAADGNNDEIQRVQNAMASAEQEWEGLLNDDDVQYKGISSKQKKALTSTTIPSSSVEELVENKKGRVYIAPLLGGILWNQEKVNNTNCYNYYTPGNWPCGCVATAMAQVMRYYRYPDASKPVMARTYECMQTVGLAETEQLESVLLSLKGGIYDWEKMPCDPTKGASEDECRAIGKLTYDCGVAVQMKYGGSVDATTGKFHRGSSALLWPVAIALTNDFHYSQAISYFSGINNVNIPSDSLYNMMLPSIAAGSPVILGIVRIDTAGDVHGRHAVVADGYAEFYDVRCVHINAGWGDAVTDAWYCPPKIDISTKTGTTKAYSVIEQAVYNIFPDKQCTVLAGKLLGPSGDPVSDATVDVNDEMVAPATVSENGIYRILLPHGEDYHLRVTARSGNMPLHQDVDVPSGESYTGRGSVHPGNLWAEDFKFPTPPDNDDFTNAWPWVGMGGVELFENVDATQEPGEPNHAIQIDELGYVPSVWYKWTAPISRKMKFEMHCPFPHVIAVYTGDSVDRLSIVAGAYGDPGSCGVASNVFDAVEGTTYRIAVVSWPESSFLTGYIKWGEAYPLDDAVGLNVDTSTDELQWFGQGDVSVDGAAGMSPPLNKGQQSWLSLGRNYPGILRMKVRVVGKGSDALVVHSDVDGVHEVIGDTGGAWVEKTIYFDRNSYEYRKIFCQYVKATDRSEGEGAWIDCMEWIDGYHLRSCLSTDFGKLPLLTDIYILPGRPIGQLPVLECEGMIFDGWRYVWPQEVAKETDIVGFNGLNLQARWIVPVEFDPNGGVFESEVPRYHYRECFGPLPEPVRDGYSFIGWFDGPDSDSWYRLESYETLSQLGEKYYAHWGPSIDTMFKGPILSLVTSKESSSWYVDEDPNPNKGTMLRNGSLRTNETTWVEIQVEGPGTLHFEWSPSSGWNSSYVARFLEDGECKLEMTDGMFDFKKIDVPISDGTHVIRWEMTRGSDGYPQHSYEAAVFLRNITWLKNVEVTLHYGEATGGDALSVFHEGFHYEELPLPYADGLTFCGWHTAPNGGSRVLPEDKVDTSISELWAHWADEIPIQKVFEGSGLEFTTGGSSPWFAQGGETSGGELSAQSGAVSGGQNSWLSTEVEGPGDISFNWKVSSEYDCDGIVFSIDGNRKAVISGTDVKWCREQFHLPSGRHTLTWKYTKDRIDDDGMDCGWIDSVTWRPCVRITLDANGGEVEVDAITVDAGGVLGLLPEATREGMVFLGWYRSGDSQDAVSADSPAGDSDAVLVAQWAKEVRFDPQGGIVDQTNRLYRIGKAYESLPEPMKTGCSFSGWYKDVQCLLAVGVDDVFDGTVEVLYSGWRLNSYSLTFVTGGDDEPLVETYIYGQTYGILPVPERQGFVFGGWRDELGNVIDSFTPVRPEDIIVYAQWNTALDAVFDKGAVDAVENGFALIKVFGGNTVRDCRVKVHLTYNTASAADMDLAKGAVDGVTPKGGLKFPLTLSWEKGEIGEKVISIPIKNDTLVEGNEFFTLQLADAQGMALGDERVCTVTIEDVGSSAQTINEVVISQGISIAKEGSAAWFVVDSEPGDLSSGRSVKLRSPLLSANDAPVSLSLAGIKGQGLLRVAYRFVGVAGAEGADKCATFCIMAGKDVVYEIDNCSAGNDWNVADVLLAGNGMHAIKMSFISCSDKKMGLEICGIRWALRDQTGHYKTEHYILRECSPISAGTIKGGGYYLNGAKATLDATAKPGWAFIEWRNAKTGDMVTRNTKLSITVDDDASYIAVFEQIPYVRGLADPADGGKVTGSGLCARGKKVTLKATANKNFTFLGWRQGTGNGELGTGNGSGGSQSSATEEYVATTPSLVIDRSAKPAAKPAASSKTSTTLTNVAEDVTYYAVFKSDPEIFVTVDATDGTGAEPTGKGAGKYVAGTITGMGKYAPGKKVTLKAAANKGYVFAGWEWSYPSGLAATSPVSGEELKNASLAFAMPSNDVECVAKFVTTDEDKASITLKVDGEALRRVEDNAPYQVTNFCGVAMNWQLAADALSATTIKVAGLPTGLKFTAKPVTSKVGSGKAAVTVTNVPANTIYGAPTAASKTDKNGNVTPSKVVFTVTTAGKSTQTFAIDLYIDPLPAWAVGTFDGAVYAGDSVEASGIVQAFTVAANGKISGKMLRNDGTWTLAADSFASYDAANGAYLATVVGKNGKLLETNEVRVAASGGVGVATGGSPSSATDPDAQERVPPSWKAYQNLWKRADTKAAQPVFKSNVPYELGDPNDPNNTLKLTFKKDGAVAFAGKVGGASVSGSSQLVIDGEGWKVTLYAPQKGTFAGFCKTLSVELAPGDLNVVTAVAVSAAE